MANICKSCKHNQINICILTKEQVLPNKQKCSSFETSYVQEQLFEQLVVQTIYVTREDHEVLGYGEMD